MSYTRRYITVAFSGQGSQGSGSSSSGDVTFGGPEYGKDTLRIFARILKAGGINYGEAQITIDGLSLEHIIKLSTYGTRYHPNYNYEITVKAGDDINGMSTVFVGNIQQAWGDMQNMPDVPFHIIAYSGAHAGMMKADPSSYSGSADVPTMLSKLANISSLGFENNGVKSKLDNPYFWGSPWKQMYEIIGAARIDGFIDDKTLAIWPRDGARAGDTLEISPKNTLRAYPSFTEYGVQVHVEFTRSIKYGSHMNITSDITPACGTWRIVRIDYDLQSNMPNGNWFAILDGARVGAPVTLYG